MKPGFGDGAQPKKNEVRRYLLGLETMVSKRGVTVPLMVEFIRYACQYKMFGEAAALEQVKEIRKLGDGIVSQFDTKRIDAFLEIAE
jgi:hypothetical protein